MKMEMSMERSRSQKPEQLEMRDNFSVQDETVGNLPPPPGYSEATKEASSFINNQQRDAIAGDCSRRDAQSYNSVEDESSGFSMVYLVFCVLFGGIYVLIHPVVEVVVGFLYFESCFLAVLTIWLGVVGLLALIPTAIIYGCEKWCCKQKSNEEEVPKRIIRLKKLRKSCFGIMAGLTGVLCGRNAYYVFTMNACQPKNTDDHCYEPSAGFGEGGDSICSEGMYTFVKYDLISRFACLGVIALFQMFICCCGCSRTRRSEDSEDFPDDYY